MINLESFTFLSFFFISWYDQDPETLLLGKQVAIFLLNLTSYIYLFLKFYKVLCYSKMTFEWLPMINPYVWPFSIFQLLTTPYFAFWAKILPSIKLDKSSVEISGIIALEALNSFIYFCVRFTSQLLKILEETEKLTAL